MPAPLSDMLGLSRDGASVVVDCSRSHERVTALHSQLRDSEAMQAAVLFLLSDAARGMTGHVGVVDGGLSPAAVTPSTPPRQP